MRAFWLLLPALLSTGCLSREAREAARLEGRFKLGDPGQGWKGVAPGGADYAFFNDSLNATIYADSNCGERYEDAPLPDLVKHMVQGVADAEQVSERSFELDGREAFTARRTGSLDGVPVELGVTVLKKDTCLYDIVLITAPGEPFERALGAYDAVVGGFKTEP